MRHTLAAVCFAALTGCAGGAAFMRGFAKGYNANAPAANPGAKQCYSSNAGSTITTTCRYADGRTTTCSSSVDALGNASTSCY